MLYWAAVFFIIGADAFAEIRTWFRWEDVLAAVAFIVVTRPGHAYSSPPGARVHRLETVAMPTGASSAVTGPSTCRRRRPTCPR